MRMQPLLSPLHHLVYISIGLPVYVVFGGASERGTPLKVIRPARVGHNDVVKTSEALKVEKKNKIRATSIMEFFPAGYVSTNMTYRW